MQYSFDERGIIKFGDDFGDIGAGDAISPDALNFPIVDFDELPVPCDSKSKVVSPNFADVDSVVISPLGPEIDVCQNVRVDNEPAVIDIALLTN